MAPLDFKSPDLYKPRKNKTKLIINPLTWCERVRFDYLIYLGYYYWTHDVAKALVVWRVAVTTGATYFADELFERERQDYESSLSKQLTKEDAMKWETTFVCDDLMKLASIDTRDAMMRDGCSMVIIKPRISTPECRTLKCGTHAFKFIFHINDT